MRIWFDTEFIEDGRTIDLISIGMVREDGAVLYMENCECDRDRASQWVKDNVFPHLQGGSMMKSRGHMAAAIRAFAGDSPEFWAYYADYDWVVLCQLYGTMMDLPKGWPMFCRDVQQWRAELGNPDMPAQANEHDALADAMWTRDAWERLRRMREAAQSIPAA